MTEETTKEEWFKSGEYKKYRACKRRDKARTWFSWIVGGIYVVVAAFLADRVYINGIEHDTVRTLVWMALIYYGFQYCGNPVLDYFLPSLWKDK